jgi:hypothetical protein
MEELDEGEGWLHCPAGKSSFHRHPWAMEQSTCQSENTLSGLECSYLSTVSKTLLKSTSSIVSRHVP